ncbi:hypothetical protein L218DRAFT_15579 [Marasmius fiardii PR-910]|nr:hypothetical protein L218DRAFT_15579 [Marasmius fiardii PR-910]
MDFNSTEEKTNETDTRGHFLLPLRRRNWESSISNSTRTTLINDPDLPSARATVAAEEGPTTQPPSATSSASSFYDPSPQPNRPFSSQLNAINGDFLTPPSSAGSMPLSFAIPNGHTMPSLDSLHSFGIPNSMQYPDAGSRFPLHYHPSLLPLMGTDDDQQRFLMAFADVYRLNMGLLQTNSGFLAPSSSIEPLTATASTTTSDPPGSVSPRISRTRSPSMAESSPPYDAEKTLPAIIRAPSDSSHIFESESGKPLLFFVQIDMTNRPMILNKIKTHGGRLEPNQAHADYSVLHSNSKIYISLLESCLAASKTAVTSSFVHDCVEHGVLFDHTRYLLQPPPRKGRRKEKTKSKTTTESSKSPVPGPSLTKLSVTPCPSVPPEVSTHSQMSAKSQSPVPSVSAAQRKSQSHFKYSVNMVSSANQPQSPVPSEARKEKQDRVKQVTDKDQVEKEKLTGKQVSHKDKAGKEKAREKPIGAKTTTTKLTKGNQATHHSGERSPSPPPLHTRVQRADGKYQYSPLEKEYVFRYIQVLFGRDHDMGVTSVAQKLHDKMPHHSRNSWLTMLNSNSVRPQIDTIKKRAGILYRKNLHSAQAADQSRGKTRNDDAENERASKRRKTDGLPLDHTVAEAQTQDDVKVLAQYLVSRQSQVADDEQNEAAFWALLSSQARCKTTMSWKEFYQKHHQLVLAKFESLLAQSETRV